MGKPSAPQSPNYPSAAAQQGQQNVEAARTSAKLSNPNFVNPYGQRTVQYGQPYDQAGYDKEFQRRLAASEQDHIGQKGFGFSDPRIAADELERHKAGIRASLDKEFSVGDRDVPTVTDTLSPTGQRRFEQEERIGSGLGNLAETGLGYVQDTLNQPFDQSKLPRQMVDAGQTGQDAILARLEPQIQQDREALRTQLYNQGISEGSQEPWMNAWRPQVQRENDLRMQAALQGIGIGDTARQRGIQEQQFFRNEPLNMLNAVRSGAPVNLPQFQNYSGANVAASPLFNAAQAQGLFDINRYGIDAGAYNNMMGGLFGLGAAFAGRGS